MARLQVTDGEGNTSFEHGFQGSKPEPPPKPRPKPSWPGPCPCECNSGGFCGGCGHAGCGGRRPR